MEDSTHKARLCAFIATIVSRIQIIRLDSVGGHWLNGYCKNFSFFFSLAFIQLNGRTRTVIQAWYPVDLTISILSFLIPAEIFGVKFLCEVSTKVHLLPTEKLPVAVLWKYFSGFIFDELGSVHN